MYIVQLSCRPTLVYSSRRNVCRQNVCRRDVVEPPYRSPLYGPFRRATNGPYQMRRPLLTSVVHDPTISFNPILIHSNTRLLRTSVTSSLKFSNRSIA